jgi:hypothetical protein
MIGYYTIVFSYFSTDFYFFSTFEIINYIKMIISYNVNGIRAAISKGFIEWLKQVNPDVVCLQEIKASQLPLLDFN